MLRRPRRVCVFVLLCAFSCFFVVSNSFSISSLPSEDGSAYLLQTGFEVRLASNTRISGAKCSTKDSEVKDLDLVVYGATGFTGGLAAKYLDTVPDNIRWAIAGRNATKLAEIQSQLVRKPPQVIVADLADADSLREMTRRTHAVLTFAGPFEPMGETLIEAAISGCSHYMDITGEAPWRQKMEQKWSKLAKNRGVLVVQSVGLDSLAADVLSLAAAEDVAKDGKGAPDDIKLVWRTMQGGMSNGTKQSGALTAQLHPEYFTEMKRELARGFGFDARFMTATVPYPMAYIDKLAVNLTMTRRFPGRTVSFQEVMSAGVMAEAAFQDKDISQLLEVGQFKGECLATRKADGKQIRIRIHGHNDPGYLGTAKMACEFALGLVQQRKVGRAGGYFFPASALGTKAIMERLNNAEGGNFMQIG